MKAIYSLLLFTNVFGLPAQCTQSWTLMDIFCKKADTCNRKSTSPDSIEMENCDEIRKYLHVNCKSLNNTNISVDEHQSEAWFKEFVMQTKNTEFCAILNACTDNTSNVYIPNSVLQLNYTEYCPYSDFCGITAPLSRDFPDCCASCTCDPDCGDRYDCCFRDDKSYVEETAKMTCLTIKTEKFNEIGIYMITTCPSGFDCLEYGVRPLSCNETRSRIYVNEKCAECNKVSIKSCKRWESSVEMLTNYVNPKMCISGQDIRKCKMVYALPNNHSAWIRYFFCGRKILSSCNSSHTDQTIVEACERVNAPFVVHRRVFPNVYCAVCIGYYTRSLCEWPGVLRSGKPLEQHTNFRIVLDMGVVADSRDATERRNIACYGGPKHTIPCRPIFCPEAMVREKGTCVYFITAWFAAQITLQIKLRPFANTALMSSLLQNLHVSDRINRNRWLINDCGMHCPYESCFLDVYMSSKTVNEIDLVEELIVFVNIDRKRIKRGVLETLNKCAHGIWTVKLCETDYLFLSDFDKYSNFIPDGKTRRKAINKSVSIQEEPLPRKHETVVSLQDGRLPILGNKPPFLMPNYKAHHYVHIVKLYFCEQVELADHEIEPLFGEIKIKHNGLILGNNEFLIDYYPTTEGGDGNAETFVARICLEDFMKDSSGRLFCSVFMMLVCVILDI